MRIALGAGSGRLVRQLLTESLVLAALGGVPGVLIAYGGAATLARLRPTLPPNYVLLRSVDLLQGVSLVPDWRVIGFAILLTIVVGLLFGAAPAIAASRTNIAELIKVAANRGGTSRARGRRALVVSQIALATTLLVAAGLMVRSFRALLRSDIGFVPENMVSVRLSGGDSVKATPQAREQLMARIAALPGVASVASYNCMPFGNDCALMPVTKVDERAVDRDEFPPIETHVVSRDFVRTLGIPLRLGRTFTSLEVPSRVTSAIINEAAARQLWRGQSPVGRRMSTLPDSVPPVDVIGVVADVKYETIEGASRPAIYYEVGQFGSFGGSEIVARTGAGVRPTAVLPSIRRLIAEADPAVAVYGIETGDEMLARAASSTRFVTTLLTSFGVLAALLAALGVYGVLAYLVSQRKREFGVRMAIGAQPSSLLGLVMRQGLWLTLGGLVVGVAGALATTRLLSSFLYGIAPSDSLTYIAIVVVVGLAGILATIIPARRATQIDPIIALRE